MPKSKKKKSRLKIGLLSVFVIAIALVGFDFFTPIGNGSYVTNNSGVIATVVGSASDRSSLTSFNEGYITPSLWGIQSGKGNTTMIIYRNGEINVVSDLWKVKAGGSIVGYPHIGFNPIPLFPIKISKFNSLTAYSSFEFYDISPFLLSADFSYDFLIQDSGNSTGHILYEVMIWEFWNDAFPVSRIISTVSLPATINGSHHDVTWLVFYAYYNNQKYPTIIFAPLNFNSKEMSWTISIPAFVESLQKILKKNLANDYIPSINIGNEFGTSLFPNEICDWTLNYWFRVENITYDLFGYTGD